ncbi:MAG: hypothetical protein ACOC56_00990 [Atribacterota bacterium]
MEFNFTPTTLFCGMGSHARSVFHYLEKIPLQKIYIIYAKKNTPKFSSIIKDIKRELKKKQENLDYKAKINYITVSKKEFLKMYRIIIRLMLQERTSHIITDITAGHKIISYAVFYAHSYAKRHFQNKSKIIYLPRDGENPIQIPEIEIQKLDNRKEDLLYFTYLYQNQRTKLRTKKELEEERQTKSKGKTLISFLNDKFSESSCYRYRKDLRDLGYLNKKDHLTIRGKMYVYSILGEI